VDRKRAVARTVVAIVLLGLVVGVCCWRIFEVGVSSPAVDPNEYPRFEIPDEEPKRKFLLGARSVDGINWKKDNKVLLHQASSPQLTHIAGKAAIYYVEAGALLKVAFRNSEGWQGRPVLIRGEQYGLRVDPHVVQLSGGSYRLYYIWTKKIGDPANASFNEVHSALSGDGLVWTREPGVRFSGEQLVDPDVVKTKEGGFRMYYTEVKDHAAPQHIKSASSRDGLRFEAEEGKRITNGCVSSTIRQADGSYGMYYQASGPSPSGTQTLLLARSTDGLVFTPVEQMEVRPGAGQSGMDRLGVESPSVHQQKDGSYMMVYASIGAPR